MGLTDILNPLFDEIDHKRVVSKIKTKVRREQELKEAEKPAPKKKKGEEGAGFWDKINKMSENLNETMLSNDNKKPPKFGFKGEY